MQRPRFLSMVTSFLVSPTPMSLESATPLVGRGLTEVAGRAFEAIEPGSHPARYLTAIARSYESEAAAMSATQALLADAGEPGDSPGIAIVNRRVRPLPEHRGGIVTWGTITGLAATRSTWAAAVVRHDNLVWDITVTGVGLAQLERIVIDLAGNLVNRSPRSWGLWDLLPDVHDMPAPMHIDAIFTSPSRTAVAA